MQTTINKITDEINFVKREPKTATYSAALRYLKECKFSIIPIDKNKKPLIRWTEFQKRLPTEQELQGWFTQWPDANIAIVTGTLSGVCVVDLDEVEIAKKALNDLIPDSLSFPVVKTPKGEHWYFKCSDPTISNNAKTINGCDQRGEGGYIIAPPSINSEGKKWSWLPALDIFSAALQPLPDAYLEAIKKPVIGEKTNSVKELLSIGATEGSRNDSLSRVAGALFQKGLTLDETLRLCVAWNQTLEMPLPLGEVERTVGSIFKKHSVESKPSGMALIRLSDLLKEPDEKVDWLVDRTLPAGGFSVIAAKPKVGKSTIARNLALCVSKGEPFLGKNVSKGSVIYYGLEEKRAEVKKHFLDMGANGTEDIFIYTGGTPVDAIQQIKKVVEDIRPVLIIIDPLFRLTHIQP